MIWSFLEVKITKRNRNRYFHTTTRSSLSCISISRFSPCLAGNSVTDTLCFLCFSTAVFHSHRLPILVTNPSIKRNNSACYTQESSKNFYDDIKLKFFFLFFKIEIGIIFLSRTLSVKKKIKLSLLFLSTSNGIEWIF